MANSNISPGTGEKSPSIELLSLKFTDPESRELLATLSSNAQRGADMVRQVLSFARGVEGRHVEVQIGQVIKDVKKIANDTFLKHIQVRSPSLWLPDDSRLRRCRSVIDFPPSGSGDNRRSYGHDDAGDGRSGAYSGIAEIKANFTDHRFEWTLGPEGRLPVR